MLCTGVEGSPAYLLQTLRIPRKSCWVTGFQLSLLRNPHAIFPQWLFYCPCLPSGSRGPLPLHPLQPPQPSADNRHSSSWKVILLMWTWISISLMIGGSKHFAIHHWDGHVYFWEESTFAHFSTEVFSPPWTWALWVPQILTPFQTYVLLMFPPLLLVLSLLSWGTEWMSLDDLQL